MPLPKTVLIMSPQMLKNYQVFGDCVSFDITYNCCRYFTKVSTYDDNVPIIKDKYWNLGVFSVFVEDCRPMICGMALILDETNEEFYTLFKLLFKATDMFPQTIITDQQGTLIATLDNFH